MPAPDRRTAWRWLPSAAAVAFIGTDRAWGPGRGKLAESLALTLVAQTRACRVALLGVRAEPVHDRRSRLLARSLAERADLVVLADDRSAQALVDAGSPAPLRVGADPVWAGLGGPLPPTDRRDVVVAAVRSTDAAGALVEPLRTLASFGLSLALQPWERHMGDATRHCAVLGEALGPATEVLAPLHDIEDARRRFAGARLVVAGSPHALMAAAAADTPFVAAGGTGAARIADALGQLASRNGDLPHALVAALEAAPPDPASVAAEIEAAEEGFRLLRLLLSDGEEGAEALNGGTRFAPEAWSA
jgi:polysaccharide pyruvyl transferase WcaK-like protein